LFIDQIGDELELVLVRRSKVLRVTHTLIHSRRERKQRTERVRERGTERGSEETGIR